MSAMMKDVATRLSESLNANDPSAAMAALADLRHQGASAEQTLSCLIPAAARTLQLRYPTPHAMIAAEWTRSSLVGLAPDRAQCLLEACVRYIAHCPKVNLRFHRPHSPGEPDKEDLLEGLRSSLDEHRVFDAFFYAERALGGPDPRAAENLLLTLAGHEVDPLGHVFIHTATGLRLQHWCEQADWPLALLAMMEFLSRRAHVDEPRLLTEPRPLSALIPRAFERINVLGHNVIYAAELNRLPDGFPEPFLQHLHGQLARNIEKAEQGLTRDEYQACRTRTKPGDTRPDNLLEQAFTNGDVEAGLRSFALAWAHPPARESVRSDIVALFARIDTLQSHYLIYPAATFSVLGKVSERDAEFGVAHLVRHGIQAAGKYGLLPATEAR